MLALADATPGMRVQTVDEHLGPSFPFVGGAAGIVSYDRQPGMERWYGSVARVSPTAGVIWVQWDKRRPGRTNPMQPDIIERASDIRDHPLWGTF